MDIYIYSKTALLDNETRHGKTCFKLYEKINAVTAQLISAFVFCYINCTIPLILAKVNESQNFILHILRKMHVRTASLSFLYMNNHIYVFHKIKEFNVYSCKLYIYSMKLEIKGVSNA